MSEDQNENDAPEPEDDAVLWRFGPGALLGGSVVLLRMSLALLIRALKAAGTTTSAKPKAKADGEEAEEEGETKAAKGKAKAKAAQGGAADTAERIAIAALCVLVAVGASGTALAVLAAYLAPYRGYVITLLVVAWVLAAASVAPERAVEEETEEEDVDAEEDEDQADEFDDDATENDHEKAGERHPSPAQRFAVAEEALLRHVLAEVLAATEAGRKGVHLVTLAQQLPDGWDVTQLRRVLGRYGIAAQKMQIRGEGNTWGVHIDALTRALRRPPEDCLAALAHAPGPAFIGPPSVLLPEAADGAAPAGPAGAPVPAPRPTSPAAVPGPPVGVTSGPALGAPGEGVQEAGAGRNLTLVKPPSPDRAA